MGERGSATLETAIIFPVIMLFIALCVSSIVILYNDLRNKTISRRDDSSNRRPCEVIRNSEYFLELADRAKNLFDIDIFKNESILS